MLSAPHPVVRRLVLVVAAALVGATACMHYPSAAQKLQKSVLTYNHCIRWQQWKSAAQFVPSGKREDFISQKEAQEDTFRVTDMEIRDVDHDDAADPPTARVVVDFTWHRYPSLTVQHTRVRQSWKLLADTWILESQEELVPEEEPETAEQMF